MRIDAAKRRASWLGRPWFFVAAVVLALNDHVFKGVWPGWLTGKLSDFAGLVVVATLASVLTGPAWGTVVAGVAFMGLKAIPGVAEVAAPLLGGGVTLRDATDLIALAALPLLWWVLRREPEPGRVRRGWIAVGLVAGVLATTATTPGPKQDAIDSLSAKGDVFTVWIPRGAGFGSVYLSSVDGGRTWAPSGEASRTPNPVDSISSPHRSSRTACAADGTCYRAIRETSQNYDEQRRVVERRESGATSWSLDLSLSTPDQPYALAVGTGGAVVLQTGERTIRYRVGPGDWREVDLVSLASPPQWQRDYVDRVGTPDAILPITILLCAVGLVVAPGRGRIAAVVVNVVIGVGMHYAGWIVLGFFFDHLGLAVALTLWAGVALVWIVAARVVHWRRRNAARQVDLR